MTHKHNNTISEVFVKDGESFTNVNEDLLKEVEDTVLVNNAVTPAVLAMKTKCFDASCLVNYILESTFDTIVDVNDEGYSFIEVDLLKEYKEELSGFEYDYDTIKLALAEIVTFLDEHGYDVSASLVTSNKKWIKEAKFSVRW